RFQLQPNVGLTQVWNEIDPKPVGSELKDATIRLLFDQWQCQGIAIERHRLFVSMGRAFDRNVGPAGKLRTMNVRYHGAKMLKPASVGHNHVLAAKLDLERHGCRVPNVWAPRPTGVYSAAPVHNATFTIAPESFLRPVLLSLAPSLHRLFRRRRW